MSSDDFDFNPGAENYYDRLGVKRDTDSDTIARAGKLAINEFHPDNASLPTEQAEEYFTRITSARDTLTEEKHREAYDTFIDRFGNKEATVVYKEWDELSINPDPKSWSPSNNQASGSKARNQTRSATRRSTSRKTNDGRSGGGRQRNDTTSGSNQTTESSSKASAGSDRTQNQSRTYRKANDTEAQKRTYTKNRLVNFLTAVFFFTIPTRVLGAVVSGIGGLWLFTELGYSGTGAEFGGILLLITLSVLFFRLLPIYAAGIYPFRSGRFTNSNKRQLCLGIVFVTGLIATSRLDFVDLIYFSFEMIEILVGFIFAVIITTLLLSFFTILILGTDDDDGFGTLVMKIWGVITTIIILLMFATADMNEVIDDLSIEQHPWPIVELLPTANAAVHVPIMLILSIIFLIGGFALPIIIAFAVLDASRLRSTPKSYLISSGWDIIVLLPFITLFWVWEHEIPAALQGFLSPSILNIVVSDLVAYLLFVPLSIIFLSFTAWDYLRSKYFT